MSDNPYDDLDSVAVAENPEPNPYDHLDKFIGMTPDTSIGSFLRGGKANLVSGIGGAIGALGGGALGSAAGPVGTFTGGVAGAGVGSAAGEGLYKKTMGDESFEKEQSQLELNRLFGHELAGGVGEMLPAFLSPVGAEKAAIGAAAKVAGKTTAEYLTEKAAADAAKSYAQKIIPGVGHALKAGAVMGESGESKHQVDTGELDPTALLTHPIEEAVKFGPVGLVPAAKGILASVGLKAPADAAVMTLTSNLYDHFAHDKPLDLSGIKDETGKSIPSFMLLNGLMGLMHGAPGMLPKGVEGKEAHEAGGVADLEVGKPKVPEPVAKAEEIQQAGAQASEATGIEIPVSKTAEATAIKGGEVDSEKQLEQVEESIQAAKDAQAEMDKASAEREKQEQESLKKSNEQAPVTTPEAIGESPVNAEETAPSLPVEARPEPVREPTPPAPEQPLVEPPKETDSLPLPKPVEASEAEMRVDLKKEAPTRQIESGFDDPTTLPQTTPLNEDGSTGESIDIRYSQITKTEPNNSGSPQVMSEEGRKDSAEAAGRRPPPERGPPKTDKGVTESIRMRVGKYGTDWMDARAKEIIADPRNITDDDVDVLGHRKVMLDERANDLYRKINSKNTTNENRKKYQDELRGVESKINLIDKAAAYALSTSGRILRSGRKAFGSNFTIEGLTESIKAANGGKEPSPKQKKWVEDVSKKSRDIKVETEDKETEDYKVNTDNVGRQIARAFTGSSPSSTSDPKSRIQSVSQWIKERGFKIGSRISVAHEAPKVVKNPDGSTTTKSWTGSHDKGRIQINAHDIKTKADLDRVLNHEILHGLKEDSEVQSKKAAFLRGMTPKERAEFENHLENYISKEKHLTDAENAVRTKVLQEDEGIPKAVEIILARPHVMSLFRELKLAIRRIFKKLTGRDFAGTDDINQLAMEVLAKGEKKFESEKLSESEKRFSMKSENKKPGYDYTDAHANEDMRLLREELTEHYKTRPADKLPQDTLKRAIRLAAHEESRTSEDTHPELFSDSVFKKIQEADPKGDFTKDDAFDAMSEWVQEQAPTRNQILTKLDQHRMLLAQADNDKAVEREKKKIERLQEKLKTGEFVKESPEQRKVSDELRALQIKSKVLQEEVTTKMLDARQQAQPAAYRLADWVARLKRFMILSSPVSVGKLMAAAALRSTLMPAEDAVGSLYSKGLGRAGKAATIEGRTSAAGYARAFTQMLTQGWKDSKQTFSEGSSDLDRKHGGVYPHGGWMSFFGRVHGAIKAPLKRFAYEAAMTKQAEDYIEQHPNMNLKEADIPPEVAAQFSVRAYQHAQRQIFMQDNLLTDKWNELVGKLDRGGDLGKLSATTLRLLLPIIRVPTNIATEALTYVGGVPAGLYNLAKVWKAGMKDIPPDQADMILRQLKKGSIGSAFMLMGYLNPQLAGGFYQRDDKKRSPKDAKVGQLKIGDWDVPKWMSHVPLLEALQVGSTLRRVSEAHDTNGHLKGLGAGTRAALWGVTKELPLIDEATRLGDLDTQHGWDKFVHEQVKSLAIPAASDFTARQMDKDSSGEPRKVRDDSLLQSLQSGIPGLRNQIPTRVTR